MFDDKLKDVSVRKLEEAIAKIVSEMTSQKIVCRVESLTFGGYMGGASVVLNLGRDYTDEADPAHEIPF